MALDRRAFLSRSSLGVALAALAGVRGPLDDLLTSEAQAASTGLSPAGLATYVALCEAACSFDGHRPPPRRLDGVAQPGAADAGRRFAVEYRRQDDTTRGTLAVLLALVEQAPRTAPPLGATSAADLAAFGGRGFTDLDVALRLRLLRSWLADENPEAVAVDGFDDVGALHRGVAAAMIQLGTFFYYQDPRTWRSLRYGGPWKGRRHEAEELPFSHHNHEVDAVLFGDGVRG